MRSSSSNAITPSRVSDQEPANKAEQAPKGGAKGEGNGERGRANRVEQLAVLWQNNTTFENRVLSSNEDLTK